MHLLRTSLIILLFVTAKGDHPGHSDPEIGPKVQDDSYCSRFRYSALLDPLGNMELHWDLDYASQQIEFCLQVQLESLLPSLTAIGFSDTGDPVDADMIVVYWAENRLDRDPFIWLRDAYTDGNGTLRLDSRQDVKELQHPILKLSDKKPGEMFVLFKRSFDTCDPNDYAIDGGTTNVIYVVPSPLPIWKTGEPFGWNLASPLTTSGFHRVQLLKPQVQVPDASGEGQALTLTVSNVAVPSDETTYWCQVHKLPQHLTEKKRHIIQFGGHIQQGNEILVHHMELFHCVVPESVEELPLYSGPCQDKRRPPILEACAKVIAAWAMGAPPLSFPAEAGKPIGSGTDGNYFSPWVMLEVHYNNPEHLAGIVDSSGISLIVTDQLRQFDAGTIELGLIYSPVMAIPPAMSTFRLEGYCLAQCTRTALPADGIRIFASQLHTHLTGRRVYTKHVRNGVELPEINRDNHYSPHFQEIRMLRDEAVVLPGDELITVCEDTTQNRTGVTLGGYAISEEMCVNYVHYYPQADLEVCKSTIDPETLMATFFKKIHGRGNNRTAGGGYTDIGNWTLEQAYGLQRLYDRSPIEQDCLQGNGESHNGTWRPLAQPVIRYPLPPTQPHCLYPY